jgi:hypothetical protein
MGHQRTYSWEGTSADGAVAGERRTDSLPISRDHHVISSLLYEWWQFSRERGEVAFVLMQAYRSPPGAKKPGIGLALIRTMTRHN